MRPKLKAIKRAAKQAANGQHVSWGHRYPYSCLALQEELTRLKVRSFTQGSLLGRFESIFKPTDAELYRFTLLDQSFDGDTWYWFGKRIEANALARSLSLLLFAEIERNEP